MSRRSAQTAARCRAGTVVLFAALTTLGTACSDRADRVVAPLRADSSVTDSTIARQVLARSNPLAWVGVAHNDAMRLTYDALRTRRLPGRNPCGEILVDDIAALAPPEYQRPAAEIEAAAAAGRSGTRCADATSARVSASSDQLSPAAGEIVTAVESALDAMTSAGELAVQLVPLTARAAALPEPERTVLLSSISVAHNSADYWFANWPAFSHAVVEQYGACVASGASFDSCSDGLARRPQASSAARTTMECDIGFLRMVRGLGKVDFVGALAGGLRAAFTGAGAALAALVGGGVSSIIWAVEGAVEQSVCTWAR